MKRRTFISMMSVMAAGVLTCPAAPTAAPPPPQAPVHPLLPVPLLTSCRRSGQWQADRGTGGRMAALELP